jgi:hypothetical protein
MDRKCSTIVVLSNNSDRLFPLLPFALGIIITVQNKTDSFFLSFYFSFSFQIINQFQP